MVDLLLGFWTCCRQLIAPSSQPLLVARLAKQAHHIIPQSLGPRQLKAKWHALSASYAAHLGQCLWFGPPDAHTSVHGWCAKSGSVNALCLISLCSVLPGVNTPLCSRLSGNLGMEGCSTASIRLCAPVRRSPRHPSSLSHCGCGVLHGFILPSASLHAVTSAGRL